MQPTRTKRSAQSALAATCLDLYLFVNPLDRACSTIERTVLDYLHTLPHKQHFHLVPFHNLESRTHSAKHRSLHPTNIFATDNTISQAMYDATLFYKAALLQGKKKGRLFLLTLQQRLTEGYTNYSLALILTIAQEVAFNTTMLLEDRHSAFVKRAYHDDQQMAKEMHIHTTPSLVIFDNINPNYGLRIERDITPDTIAQAMHMCCDTAGGVCIPRLCLIK